MKDILKQRETIPQSTTHKDMRPQKSKNDWVVHVKTGHGKSNLLHRLLSENSQSESKPS